MDMSRRRGEILPSWGQDDNLASPRDIPVKVMGYNESFLLSWAF